MTKKTTAFIGAGNMARALAGGLLQGSGRHDRLILADPTEAARDAAATLDGAEVTADNLEAVAAADAVVLAVKPQILEAVCRDIASAVAEANPLVISVAAGITVPSMAHWLGGHRRIVRAMPNTPALIGLGACGLYAGPDVDDADRAHAQAIVDSVGISEWVDEEDDLDAVTALSGSGPAYFFLLMENLVEAAIAQGLSPAAARRLTLATARGAAEMAERAGQPLDELRRAVTSPGGTTEAALRTMVEEHFDLAVTEGLGAAVRRSRELASEFGKDGSR